MKSSEVFRWMFRHNATCEFKAVQGGTNLQLMVEHRHIWSTHDLLIRDHDKAADDICRFVDKISREHNLE